MLSDNEDRPKKLPHHGMESKCNVFFDNFSALFRFIIYSAQNQFK